MSPVEMQSDEQPQKVIPRHYDVVKCRKDGGLVLGASSLTGRLWGGSLWYYKDQSEAPDVDKSFAMIELGSGIADAQWVDDFRIVTAVDSGVVSLWQLTENFDNWLWLCSSSAHDDIVNSVSVLANRSQCVSGSHDRKVKIFDFENGITTHSYKGHCSIVWSVAAHPTDQQVFTSVSQDGKALMWDLRSAKPASIIDIHPIMFNPSCVCWQPQQKDNLLIASETGELVIKDIRQTGTLHSSKPHSRFIHRAAFCPKNSNLVATVSEDSTVAVTDLSREAASILLRDERHSDFVRGISWSSADSLVTCGWDSQLLSHTIGSPVAMDTESRSTTSGHENNHKEKEV